MNILLISPSQKIAYGKLKSSLQIHMGLAYIASVLKQSKYYVRIMDIDAENVSIKSFIAALNDKHYDIVGFTATTPTFFSCLELAKEVKKYSSGTLTVFGGVHSTIKALEVIMDRILGKPVQALLFDGLDQDELEFV